MTEEDQRDKDILRAQADLLREALQDVSRRPSAARRRLPARISAVAVIGTTVVVALWLLVSKEARDGLLQRLVSEDPIGQASTITVRNLPRSGTPAVVIRGGQVHPLEPTQPLPARQTPRLDRSEAAGSRPPAGAVETPRRGVSTGEEGVAPQSGTSGQGESSSGDTPGLLQTEPGPTPSPGAQVSQATGGAAYDLVLSGRAKMRQLVSQGSSQWRVVKEDDGTLWIDIVVAREGEEHYIWAVNLQKQTVEPLSQAARNLEE